VCVCVCFGSHCCNSARSYLVNETCLWVVMEYMDGGCLTEILEQFDSVRMSEPHIAYLSIQTLKGLEYIHSKHRIHRDIKSDNIVSVVCARVC
jgi:protein-serine/threonine kinase